MSYTAGVLTSLFGGDGSCLEPQPTPSRVRLGGVTLRGLVIDMDGVLWHGDTPLPGLSELFGTLRRQGLPFVLATNNATKTVGQYVEKLARLGVRVAPEQVLTSPGATAGFLRERYPAGTNVYVVGEAGLRETLADAGFRVVGPEEVRAGEGASVVVGGLVTASLSYDLLAYASLLVRGGAAFVATNFDATYPSELGEVPGAGAMLAPIVTATGVTPTVIGKPYPAMFTEALRRLGTPAAETLMVGDRLETDIDGAHAAGLQTALVLTGISKRDDLGDRRVDYVLEDLAALREVLESSIAS